METTTTYATANGRSTNNKAQHDLGRWMLRDEELTPAVDEETPAVYQQTWTDVPDVPKPSEPIK